MILQQTGRETLTSNCDIIMRYFSYVNKQNVTVFVYWPLGLFQRFVAVSYVWFFRDPLHIRHMKLKLCMRSELYSLNNGFNAIFAYSVTYGRYTLPVRTALTYGRFLRLYVSVRQRSNLK